MYCIFQDHVVYKAPCANNVYASDEEDSADSILHVVLFSLVLINEQ